MKKIPLVDILQRNGASEDWHTTHAQRDRQVGSVFSSDAEHGQGLPADASGI
jgi:hypothetical protein